jgi:hypothetical protein
MRRMNVNTSAPARVAGLAIVALSLTACISVRSESGVRNADRQFERAYAEIARIEGIRSGEVRRPRRLCVLVHDQQEGELVRVSIPMWLVEAGLSLGADASGHKHGRPAGDRYDLEWSAIKDLGRYGRGLLASVEEEKARVLVWLK